MTTPVPAPPPRWSIGRFSRMTRLSARRLRHYDAVGLLRPAYIDPFTGYRYYSDPELHQAMGERGLKSAGPSFERYLVGPARTSDQSAWRTEVCFPVVA